MLMADAKTNEKLLSKEMTELLEEFGACFQWDKAHKLIPKIDEQGKKDGLSKERIRELLFLHFKGKLSDRQLRRLFPLELKYPEFANKRKNVAGKADMMSASVEEAGIDPLANEPEASTGDSHIMSGHTSTEIQEQIMGGNIPDTGHTKPACAATVEEEVHERLVFYYRTKSRD